MDKALSTSLHFAPLLGQGWLIFVLVIGACLFLISVFAYKRALLVRLIMFLAFVTALLNPSLVQEERAYVRDVATIVVDRSGSQYMGERMTRTDNALMHLEKTIRELGAFDLRIVEAPQDGRFSNRSDLFAALDQALADVPQKRRAGVIFLTDGQVHDVLKNEEAFKAYGPVHQLLSGKKDERDRQIVITNAPAYGLVGKDIVLKYRVEDTKNIGATHANVYLTLHTGRKQTFYVPIGQDQSVRVPLAHAGDNIFSLEVEAVKDELTLTNNKSAILINGVRDRLKVLLVSGIPHSGERTWRDLLTSDPGVDLIHFTILREPQKFDYTPKNELSLIAFPFQELFETKLNDFDLIIFDRYRVNNILPDRYFHNIVNYVKKGGAFLEASGPAFSGKRSIYDTPLGEILPARPTGEVFERAYKPELTKLGYQHPVTESLVWNNIIMSPQVKTPSWGNWLRYVDVKATRGEPLMSALGGRPLLILDRVGQGRVAQLSSDHIWLWSRGYNGGGPHAELLRRIVHWLMKEPELDERAMDVRVNRNTITISKKAYDRTAESIAVTRPNGEQDTISLRGAKAGTTVTGGVRTGWLEHQMSVDEPGIYAFEDTNGMRKFAIIGDLNAPEQKGIKTTTKLLSPLVKASKGATIWLDDTPMPQVVLSGARGRYGGSDWIALRQNDDYTVTGVRDIALFPEWVMLLILLSTLIFLWWREGDSRPGS